MTSPSSVSMRERSRTPYPSVAWVLARPRRLFAFGFGSGLIRPMSGTWGTALAWLVWIVCTHGLHFPLGSVRLGALLLVGFIYGCWACHRVGVELKVHDHVGMVWDEMVAFWIVLWMVPSAWTAQLAAFVLFRFFDIVKPPPIAYFDKRLANGFGVMWDDIIAAVYALILMAVAVRLGVWS